MGEPPVVRIANDGKRMILIPEGRFLRGINLDDVYKMFPGDRPRDRSTQSYVLDATPQKQIYLHAYYIDETPVTNAEYKKFVDSTGHRVPGCHIEPYAKSHFQELLNDCLPYSWDEKQRTFPLGLEDHPVVLVSWADANEYARWAGKRLPTEAEWEKAARGIDGRVYPWGNEWDRNKCNSASWHVGKDITEYEDWRPIKDWLDTEIRTTPVGQFKVGASPYGCLDMAGNVEEWCADWYERGYYSHSPMYDPAGPAIPEALRYKDRVIRGSSFRSALRQSYCAKRNKWPLNSEYKTLGFRCVMPVTS